MSSEDVVVLASRSLALLLTVSALIELSYLPGSINSFRHYVGVELSSPSATQYYRQANLISLSFLVVRIIGYSLLARWLFKGGPEVVNLLLPSTSEIVVNEGSQEQQDNGIR